MSKSDTNPKSAIYLLDDPEDAYKKILKAVTDSEGKIYLSDEKPGIKNLLTIYSALNDISLQESAEKFKNSNYGEFKNAVAQCVKEFLIKIQDKYKNALNQIETLSKEGAKRQVKLPKLT